ncbi:hypothetical protein K491DRAFT_21322 [Lophiostoma macrostomum CBS 122681]|uniref:Uncharacterized protein n=1 Tax=Lophiostoma macrostomum CBS 122681 TaxID=1314788 RepID=A0A6A6T2P7_9PLEO|nr:hypothetical protein K491DRAFT_21322 [Lophiostoma macrostomum CBS 122681]
MMHIHAAFTVSPSRDRRAISFGRMDMALQVRDIRFASLRHLILWCLGRAEHGHGMSLESTHPMTGPKVRTKSRSPVCLQTNPCFVALCSLVGFMGWARSW